MWMERDEELGRLLEVGKLVGQERFKRILKYDPTPVENVDCTLAAKILYTPESDEALWGQLAAKQKKACKRMAKTIYPYSLRDS